MFLHLTETFSFCVLPQEYQRLASQASNGEGWNYIGTEPWGGVGRVKNYVAKPAKPVLQ